MEANTKNCPYCGGEIMAAAKKCKHCKKWLEPEYQDIEQPISEDQSSTDNQSALDSQSSSTEVTEEQVSTTQYKDDNSGEDSSGNIIKGLIIFFCTIIGIILFLQFCLNYAQNHDKEETTIYTESTSEAVTDDYTGTEEAVAEEYIDSQDYVVEESSYDISDSDYQDKAKIIGTYTANVYDDIQHDIYVITSNTITEYEWNEFDCEWYAHGPYTYRIKYSYSDDYMYGLNIVYTDSNGYENRWCFGDLDSDGIMDMWCTDGMYFSKSRIDYDL